MGRPSPRRGPGGGRARAAAVAAAGADRCCSRRQALQTGRSAENAYEPPYAAQRTNGRIDGAKAPPTDCARSCPRHELRSVALARLRREVFIVLAFLALM